MTRFCINFNKKEKGTTNARPYAAFFRRKLDNPLSFSKESGQRKLTILVCASFIISEIFAVGDGAHDIPQKTISFAQISPQTVGDGALDIPQKTISFAQISPQTVGDGAHDIPQKNDIIFVNGIICNLSSRHFA